MLTVVLLALSVAGAVLCFAHVRSNAENNELVKSSIDEMQGKIKQLNGEGEKVQQQLSPEERAVLRDASVIMDKLAGG